MSSAVKFNYLPRTSLVAETDSLPQRPNTQDPFRPLPLNLVQKGWESDRQEHSVSKHGEKDRE